MESPKTVPIFSAGKDKELGFFMDIHRIEGFKDVFQLVSHSVLGRKGIYDYAINNCMLMSPAECTIVLIIENLDKKNMDLLKNEMKVVKTFESTDSVCNLLSTKNLTESSAVDMLKRIGNKDHQFSSGLFCQAYQVKQTTTAKNAEKPVAGSFNRKLHTILSRPSSVITNYTNPFNQGDYQGLHQHYESLSMDSNFFSIDLEFQLDPHTKHKKRTHVAQQVAICTIHSHPVYHVQVEGNKHNLHPQLTLKEVQLKNVNLEIPKVNHSNMIEHLRLIIGKNDVIVGHHLVNDFKEGLKLWHPYVVDTAYLYKHININKEEQQGLKNLAWNFLNKRIQTSQKHDPMVDAQTTAQMVKTYVENFLDDQCGEDYDLKFEGAKNTKGQIDGTLTSHIFQFLSAECKGTLISDYDTMLRYEQMFKPTPWLKKTVILDPHHIQYSDVQEETLVYIHLKHKDSDTYQSVLQGVCKPHKKTNIIVLVSSEREPCKYWLSVFKN